MLSVAGIYMIVLLLLADYRRHQDETTWLEGETEIDWNQKRIPLAVTIGREMPRYQEAFVRAIEDFNDRVGCRVFYITTDLNVADTMFAVRQRQTILGWLKGDEPRGNSHDEGWKVFIDGDQYAVSVVEKPRSGHNAYYKIYHELGHVIGLAPDTSVISIMNETVKDQMALDGDLGLTENDADALRLRYCR